MIDPSHPSKLNESRSQVEMEMGLDPEMLIRVSWELAACRLRQQPTENLSIMRWSAR